MTNKLRLIHSILHFACILCACSDDEGKKSNLTHFRKIEFTDPSNGIIGKGFFSTKRGKAYHYTEINKDNVADIDLVFVQITDDLYKFTSPDVFDIPNASKSIVINNGLRFGITPKIFDSLEDDYLKTLILTESDDEYFGDAHPNIILFQNAEGKSV